MAGARLVDRRLASDAQHAADELQQELNAQIHAQSQMMEQMPRLELELDDYKDKVCSIKSVCELHSELALANEIKEQILQPAADLWSQT